MERTIDPKVLTQFAPLAQTSLTWVRSVEARFDRFVADHASNERKAAASAMDFVVRYPDCLELVAFAAKVAQQELAHFRQVFKRMRRSGFSLAPDVQSRGMNHLISFVRPQREERRMDRILLAALMERRGMERFSLLHRVANLPDGWNNFYGELAEAERDHWTGYVAQAILLADFDQVRIRWAAWVEHEAKAPFDPTRGQLFP